MFVKKSLTNHAFVLMVFLAINATAQNTLTIQADSIYQGHKVKARHQYGGNSKFHVSSTFFDRKGRKTRYSKPDNHGFTENNTYYVYDASGRLIKMVDSVKTRIPSEVEIEQLTETGLVISSFLPELEALPGLKVLRYELTYEGSQLTRIAKFNPNESLQFIDSIQNLGLLSRKYWYWENKLYRVDTTKYLTPDIPNRISGWANQRGYRYEWELNYDLELQGSNVQSFTCTREDGESASSAYFYDDYGLLIRVENGLFDYEYPSIDHYEYEYYE